VREGGRQWLRRQAVALRFPSSDGGDNHRCDGNETSFHADESSGEMGGL
jgi:hypothetical protein